METPLAAGQQYIQPRFIREPADAYHSRGREFFTSHQLQDFRACPLRHRQIRAGLTAAVVRECFVIGGGLHAWTLEGQAAFDSRYISGGPINPKTERPYGEDTNKFREWAATQERICLSHDQAELIARMTYAVRHHAEAAELLRHGEPEGVLRAAYLNIECQIRADWFNPFAGLLDLKSCENLDNFEADIVTWAYVEQLAFYRTILRNCTGQTVPAWLIGVEKNSPHRVGVWRIKPKRIAAKERSNDFYMRELAACLAHDVWPTRFEAIRYLG